MTSSRVISFRQVRNVPNEHDFVDLLRYVDIFRLQIPYHLIIWKIIDDRYRNLPTRGARLNMAESQLFQKPDDGVTWRIVRSATAPEWYETVRAGRHYFGPQLYMLLFTKWQHLTIRFFKKYHNWYNFWRGYIVKNVPIYSLYSWHATLLAMFTEQQGTVMF
jgi:hypothetical protein